MIRRQIAIMILLAMSLAACGHHRNQYIPKPPVRLTILLHPDFSANNGEVFWVVIKEVDDTRFSNDTYEEIESILSADEWQPDVLSVVDVVPGEERRVSVVKPYQRHVGFYFLVTDPRYCWKALLRNPIGSKCRVRIGQYDAVIDSVGGSW